MSDSNDYPIRLIGNEAEIFAKQNLVQLKVDTVNWKILWKDPHTGEFWKEHFPQSEMHGGGPPEFVKITQQDAEAEFVSW